MIYWKQLKSLLLHKWYVFLVGRRVGVSLWRLVIHDWSKFMPVEFVNYARYKYGVKDTREWSKAWLHHLHYNPHHPEHWLLSWHGNPNFYDEVGEYISSFVTLLPMPETYVREMIADMSATSKAITGSWNISSWLNKNGPDMHFRDETVTLIDKVMKELGYVLTDNCDWSWIAGRQFRSWSGEKLEGSDFWIKS